MKIDYYGLRLRDPQRCRVNPWTGHVYARCTVDREPDLEHELAHADAIARARRGERVIVKVWLLTDGVADLERLEAAVREAVKPLGLI